MIFNAAARAVSRLMDGDSPNPFVLDSPIRATVEFFSSDMADRASLMPATIRDGTRVTLAGQTMDVVYRGFRALLMLASSG
jgi:D-aminopeptidase